MKAVSVSFMPGQATSGSLIPLVFSLPSAILFHLSLSLPFSSAASFTSFPFIVLPLFLILLIQLISSTTFLYPCLSSPSVSSLNVLSPSCLFSHSHLHSFSFLYPQLSLFFASFHIIPIYQFPLSFFYLYIYYILIPRLSSQLLSLPIYLSSPLT